MEIIKVWVKINPDYETGVGVKIYATREVTKGKKCYSGKGIRLPFEEFDVPIKPTILRADELGFDIWTTRDNIKESVKKCVVEILKDYEENYVPVQIGVEKLKKTLQERKED